VLDHGRYDVRESAGRAVRVSHGRCSRSPAC
jgi:hypothetical protein